MSIISKEEFLDLSGFNNEICISMFIPTQRAGKEVLEEKNQKHLKSIWKEVRMKLQESGVNDERINVIGEPIVKLIEDKNFWRHQSDGLAVFASEGILRKYTLPINFEAFHYIGKEFYLKPLIPALTENGRFYILELQIFKVKLYEATRYSIGEVEIDDLTPSRLEDRVGYDYEEKNRNHETQNNLRGTSVTHGYDAANRDRKNEFLRFFKAVDKGLDTILHEEKVPLIVACQDYLFPIYQEANTYKHLYEKCIPGNPSDYRNMFDLHEKAVEQLKPFFDKEREEKLKKFNDLPPYKKSANITEIIPSVYEGKVDTLFLENREDLFGTFDEEKMTVEVHNQKNEKSVSLMNLAAKKVIEQGGSVFLVESAFMPDKKSKINALLRYNY